MSSNQSFSSCVPESHQRPIVVDLDGTLIRTDVLHESLIQLLKVRPYLIFLIPLWWIKGKAFLKRRILDCVELNVATFPYNQVLINWLLDQKSLNRKLILCSASDISVVQAVANYLKIFDLVLASDGKLNLSGKNKAHQLVDIFGEKNFDYVGNSYADFHVWKYSREAIVVNHSRSFVKKVGAIAQLGEVIDIPRNKMSWISALRLHQWVKNTLIFIPILAAHQVVSFDLMLQLIYAFISFSLCASAIYIANDLFDLDSDRQHPHKCQRPFASGNLSVAFGVALIPVLLLISLMSANAVNLSFTIWLSIYLILTILYSWVFKRLVLIDCLVLAVLHTLRLVAGAVAVGVDLSFWLLAYSIFIFISLAFLKRYGELKIQKNRDLNKAHGRGYYVTDAPLILQLGVVSGYAAVLVLALYLNSENVFRFYQTPQFIWGAVPLMLWWVSWMWLQVERGNMSDDPIIFAIKDPVSWFIGSLFIATFILATLV